MSINITPEQQTALRAAMRETFFATWPEAYLSSPQGQADLDNHAFRRFQTCVEQVVPWVARHVELSGALVVEVGCGTGSGSAAFASGGATVHGYDIDEVGLTAARRRMEILGLRGAEFSRVEPERLAETLRDRYRAVDVVFLFAVLEHQTIAERLETLRTSWQVLKPGGVLVVFDTPNRLTYMDHHTAILPFFHQLPDEICLQYWERSPRKIFRDWMKAGLEDPGGDPKVALARLGRGVSYHEFELAIGRLDGLVVADGFDQPIVPARPVMEEERLLGEFFRAARLDVPIGFSRACVDVILKKPHANEPKTAHAANADDANGSWYPSGLPQKAPTAPPLAHRVLRRTLKRVLDNQPAAVAALFSRVNGAVRRLGRRL